MNMHAGALHKFICSRIALSIGLCQLRSAEDRFQLGPLFRTKYDILGFRPCVSVNELDLGLNLPEVKEPSYMIAYDLQQKNIQHTYLCM